MEKLEAVIEAYEKLNEEQKALLPGADAQLKELLDYLTEPAAPLAEEIVRRLAFRMVLYGGRSPSGPCSAGSS